MPADTRISIIICAYNDWIPLDRCLRSLSEQLSPPSFEVVVVDDGSDEEAPACVRNWVDHFSLEIFRQEHEGISSARNRGIRQSKGLLLLFVDSDCLLDPACLAALDSASSVPDRSHFQLRLSGSLSTVVGKSEELRLMTLQHHLLQSDGCIRYLNTAGFAIKRMSLES